MIFDSSKYSPIWIDWLEEIQQVPKKHKLIIKDGKFLRFLQDSPTSRKSALSSAQILQTSKKIAGNRRLTVIAKHRLVSGAQHIITEREGNFNELGVISKFFAKLRGVQRAIHNEKSKIANLKLKIDIQAVLFMTKQVQELKNIKSSGVLVNLKKKRNFNERFFQCAKNLYMIKKSLPIGHRLLHRVNQLEEQLYRLNPNLTPISTLAKLFGPQAIRSSLKDTVSSLCELHQLDQKDLKRDCKLFNCDSIEMQSRYVKNLVKVYQTGFSLSTVTEIEKTWKKMLDNPQGPDKEERMIDGQQVIFIRGQSPGKIPHGDIYIKGKFFAAGAFKAAFLATAFLEATKKDDIDTMVILQPLDSVKDEIEAQRPKPIVKKKEQEIEAPMKKSDDSLIEQDQSLAEPVSTAETTCIQEKEEGAILQNFEESDREDDSVVVCASARKNFSIPKSSIPVPVDFPEKVSTPSLEKLAAAKEAEEEEEEANRQAYQKEAMLCLEVGKLPGIWPTHKITEISGDMAIIQKAAGFSLENQSSRKVFNLDHMSRLALKGELTIKDQIAFLGMLGDFLTGVHSLHGEGIIHRDLKPSNILCGQEGHSGISDFGTACRENIMIGEEGAEQLVADPDKENFTGTNYYLAPEIALWTTENYLDAWKHINTRADMWSVGIILWELLAGKKPHQHPAIRYPNPLAYITVGELLNSDRNEKFYNDYFPKPEDENSLLYLIWSCTRVNPVERMDIEMLIPKYKRWASDVAQRLKTGELTSIYEAFKLEQAEESF